MDRDRKGFKIVMGDKIKWEKKNNEMDDLEKYWAQR